MTMTTNKRFKLVAGIVLGLVALVMVATHFAGRVLKDQVVQALGPESELQSIHLGLTGVVVEGLRIHGPKGWPADDTLRAERVSITPDLRSLFSGTYRIGSITVEKAYLSALRTNDGRIHMVPSLLDKPADKKTEKETQAKGEAMKLAIGHVELRDCALEFFDATVRRPPFKVRLEQLHAQVSDLLIPELTARSDIALDGVIKGVQRDGHVSIKGWIETATKESSIKTSLRGIDLVALEPYLIKASETGVQRGTLDLEVQSDVRKKQLQAPGVVTLSGLKLSSSGGSFMGVPRQMVVSLLKNGKDQISVKFKLDGDLDNPHFSLNEAFATRLASGMAETMGVSLSGLAGGVGTMGQKGAQAAGEAVKGVGGAIGDLFSSDKKK